MWFFLRENLFDDKGIRRGYSWKKFPGDRTIDGFTDADASGRKLYYLLLGKVGTNFEDQKDFR